MERPGGRRGIDCRKWILPAYLLAAAAWAAFGALMSQERQIAKAAARIEALEARSAKQQLEIEALARRVFPVNTIPKRAEP